MAVPDPRSFHGYNETGGEIKGARQISFLITESSALLSWQSTRFTVWISRHPITSGPPAHPGSKTRVAPATCFVAVRGKHKRKAFAENTHLAELFFPKTGQNWDSVFPKVRRTLLSCGFRQQNTFPGPPTHPARWNESESPYCSAKLSVQASSWQSLWSYGSRIQRAPACGINLAQSLSRSHSDDVGIGGSVAS